MVKYVSSILLFCLAAVLAPARAQEAGTADSVGGTAAVDGLSAPLYAPFVRPWAGMYGCVPTLSATGPGSWLLHEGFNAQLSLSVTAGLGRGAPGGVGFGQDAAFMYALPLTGRLSVAAGVYMSHMDWGGYAYRQAGFSAVAAYRLNERVSLYAYGNKAFLPHGVPPFWSPYVGGDRFGGMVHVKFSNAFSMGFSLERSSHPSLPSGHGGYPGGTWP